MIMNNEHSNSEDKTSNARVESVSAMLTRLEQIPRTRKQLSVFEVSGYAHHENMVSNILAFYLDANLEHQMGTLALSALLMAAELPYEEVGAVLAVHREYPTLQRGRLDLLVVSERYVIGIENKINAPLYNNLQDYGETIDGICNEQQSAVKLLLTMTEITKQDELSGFQIVNYKTFLSCLKTLIQANSLPENKWSMYLYDFISALDAEESESMELNELEELIIANPEKVDELLLANQALTKKYQRHMDAIKEQLPSGQYHRWHFGQYQVFDFEFNGAVVALDFYISHAHGWSLMLFGRKKEGKQLLDWLITETDLGELIANKPPEKQNGEWKYRLFSLPHSTAKAEILSAVNMWLDKVSNCMQAKLGCC